MDGRMREKRKQAEHSEGTSEPALILCVVKRIVHGCMVSCVRKYAREICRVASYVPSHLPRAKEPNRGMALTDLTRKDSSFHLLSPYNFK